MKKIFIVIALLSIVGCSNETQTREKEFKEAAIAYYNDYISELNLDIYFITLEQLDAAIAVDNKEYKIDSLKDCDRTSKITMEIVEEDFKNVEYELNCEQ